MNYKTLKAYMEALGFTVSVGEEYIEISKTVEVVERKIEQYSYDVDIIAAFDSVIGLDEPVTIEWMWFKGIEFLSSKQIKHLISISRDIEGKLVDAGAKFDKEYPFIREQMAEVVKL